MAENPALYDERNIKTLDSMEHIRLRSGMTATEIFLSSELIREKIIQHQSGMILISSTILIQWSIT
jgi:hypothetical protein